MKKIAYLVVVILSMTLLFLSCGKDDDSQTPETKVPIIEKVEPNTGPVGTTVVLDGMNFGDAKGDNTVKFNGQAATIQTASTTRLVVTVPDGATTGKITVKVGDKTATSASDFVVTKEGPSAIELNKTSLVLFREDTETILINNIDDFEETAEWETSDANIATVDSEGTITAVDVGTIEVTATIGELTAKITVTVNPDIYVGGEIIRQGDNFATVWKNGNILYLLNGAGDAGVSSIVGNGEDIFATGHEYVEGDSQPRLWKNGTKEVLNNVPIRYGRGNAVYIDGQDVWVVGSIVEEFKENEIGIAWKNGSPVNLTSGMHTNTRGADMFVDETGTYILGMGDGPTRHVMVWDGGETPVLLNSGEYYADAFSIKPDGNGGYLVVGYEENADGVDVAKYWTGGEGESVVLGNGADDSEARSVAVDNGDIYVAGHQGVEGMIWKNGVEWVTLNEESITRFVSIQVFGDDVFVTGVEIDFGLDMIVAKVWKINKDSGEIVQVLDMDIDGTGESLGLSIFVK
ncbi:IPT/TIG domain-containing protein [Flagellimonas nanhaiensis]|uniref:IPT/TIG domain-containing protein n=1 Tax=Flagellimonas nanhaiensis TaxID=2292706 RepID=A0A371JQE4_9FLAO|nr:IPT/TIG domain-containing protein [Allomuricauda nanhaiensis]RDY59696.1 hypothetical protein DX873_10030 [Allomuricauda nanhaiensis]